MWRKQTINEIALIAEATPIQAEAEVQEARGRQSPTEDHVEKVGLRSR